MERNPEPPPGRPAEEDVGATAPVPPADPTAVASYPYRAGDLVLPGYRLVKRLGRGGFGEVWRATAPGGMGVAIKVLANLGRREGGREYRALQTVKDIRHPHIVPIFGVWLKSGSGHVLDDAEIAGVEKHLLHHNGTDASRTAANSPGVEDEEAALTGHELVIAMGLGDQTLHDRLRQSAGPDGGGGIPREMLLVWMRQAALAIDYFNRGAHGLGENRGAVQHCDIKPQNILLVGDAVQVCDFGLARLQGEVRATNTNMASLAYAAPELLQPPHDPSPSTDQYSLAISYHEMRTGRLPFDDVRPVSLLRSKLDGRLTFAGVSVAEAEVLGRATSQAPLARFPTCTAFVEALDRSGVPVDTSAARDRSWSSVARWGFPAGGIALLAAVTVAWWSMARRERDAPSTELQPSAVASAESLEQMHKEAVRLEREGAFAAAGEAYAKAIVDSPDMLAATLWDLQTQAADIGHHADCIPLLLQLDGLYRGEPVPRVKGITRWDVVNSLGWYLATVEPLRADAAQRSSLYAEEALSLAGEDEASRAQSLDTLAVSLARQGLHEEAVKRIDEAIGLVRVPAERESFERHREAFAAGRAWSEP